MKVVHTQESFELGDVTLLKTKWEMMNYGLKDTNRISFPGEYDIKWVTYKCIDAGDMLHYIIHDLDGTWTAILQSSAALEKENIDGIDTRYVADESIQKEIENLELNGEFKIFE